MRLNGISEEIKSLMYEYIGIRSDTGTILERDIEGFLMNFFESIEYFKQNTDHYGCYHIKNDPLNRGVMWGLVKGRGKDTVVLIHHNDVVDTLDFKTLDSYAYKPDELKVELIKIKDDLEGNVQEDLLSDEYIFGRGSADMKSGGAIQLSLLKRYSMDRDLRGNVLVLSVPDEENISAGMRGAIDLLCELKSKYDLNYVATINSEPHQRKSPQIGVISEGSVGKLMPLIYVRGNLAHVGKVFEGFNPVPLLSRIVVNTDLSLELTDVVGEEGAPPPTWIYLKDAKQHYDVSMPLSITGYLSVLTLNSNPKEIVDKIHRICSESFDTHINEMSSKFKTYCRRKGKESMELPWVPNVITFEELYKEALDNWGERFAVAYNKNYKDICIDILENRVDLMEATNRLIEFTFTFINDLNPRVVIALAPPYYPNVSNLYFSKNIKGIDLTNSLIDYSKKEFGQKYEREYFFTGISDLSYTSIRDYKSTEDSICSNMPLYGDVYSIPLQKIEALSMPCFNIGPWGKDFHKLTERVLKDDVYNRTPRLLDHGIGYLLNWHLEK